MATSLRTVSFALGATEIYTRVSIGHLEIVHDRPHPGAKLERGPRVCGAETNES